jgi:hypothetical protein
VVTHTTLTVRRCRCQCRSRLWDVMVVVVVVKMVGSNLKDQQLWRQQIVDKTIIEVGSGAVDSGAPSVVVDDAG